MRFAIVVSRFNQSVTDALLASALKTLKQKGIAPKDVKVVQVPGGWEIPYAAHKLAKSKKYAAVIALGCVLKGQTKHNHYISQAVAFALQQSTLETGTPIIFGILTPDTMAQAKARAAGNSADKGMEAAEAAWEMAQLKL